MKPLYLIVTLTILLAGCASNPVPPLQAQSEAIEIEQFMGDWYVVGFIPITIPGFSEASAHNGVENYELTEDGTILTTYTFLKGGFDGKEKKFTPKGWVYNTGINTEWRMQFVWPIKAAYLIAWVDEDYQQTIIGVPSRKNVWLMSRNWDLSDEEYAALAQRAVDMGHDASQIRRVPHQWE